MVLLFSLFIKSISIFKWYWSNFYRFSWLVFEQYSEYSSCLMSFLSFCELFPAFKCAKVIGNLVSIWSGVNTLSPWPVFFFVPQNFCFLNQSYLLVFLVGCKFFLHYLDTMFLSFLFCFFLTVFLTSRLPNLLVNLLCLKFASQIFFCPVLRPWASSNIDLNS